MLSVLLTGKLAAMAVCTSIGLGGAATAAYANALPAPIQSLAHDTIGAPAPHGEGHAKSTRTEVPSPVASTTSTRPSETPKPTPVESAPPTVDGTAAAYGLCHAFQEANTRHVHLEAGLQERLVRLAGSTDNIVAFCLKVSKPTPNPSEHRTTSPTPAWTHGDPNSYAAIGLCYAFRHGVVLPDRYEAMLKELAGGTDHVVAFCATVPEPKPAPTTSAPTTTEPSSSATPTPTPTETHTTTPSPSPSSTI